MWWFIPHVSPHGSLQKKMTFGILGGSFIRIMFVSYISKGWLAFLQCDLNHILLNKVTKVNVFTLGAWQVLILNLAHTCTVQTQYKAKTDWSWSYFLFRRGKSHSHSSQKLQNVLNPTTAFLFLFHGEKWVFIVDYSLSRGLCLAWVCVFFSFLIQHLWAVDVPSNCRSRLNTFNALAVSGDIFLFLSLWLSFPRRREWQTERKEHSYRPQQTLIFLLLSLCLSVKLNRSAFLNFLIQKCVFYFVPLLKIVWNETKILIQFLLFSFCLPNVQVFRVSSPEVPVLRW